MRKTEFLIFVATTIYRILVNNPRNVGYYLIGVVARET